MTKIAAILIVLLIVSLIVVRAIRGTSAHANGVGRLADADPERRPVEGRLFGVVRHAQFAPEPPPQPAAPSTSIVPSRGSSEEVLARMRAAAELYAVNAESPTPRAAGDVGIVQLYEGDSRAAVEELRRAVAMDPQNAGLLNDLAVAYLAVARNGQSPEARINALATIERAVRANPDLPEVRFNRALAIESLHLTNGARLAWDEYLALDASSPWASEASSHRAALDTPDEEEVWKSTVGRLDAASSARDADLVREIVEAFPNRARAHARDELLPAWAAAALDGDAAAAEIALFSSRIIGQVLAESQGDTFVAEAVGEIERAGSATPVLARAHRDLQSGQQRFLANDLVAARVSLELARDGFVRAASRSFAGLAEIAIARCEFYRFEYDAALARVREVRLACAPLGYAHLLGHTWWIEATIRLRKGDALGANEAYETGIGLFERTGDWGNRASLQAYSAQCLNLLGMRTDASTRRIEALDGLRGRGKPDEKAILFWYVAYELVRDEQFGAALDFQQEFLTLAEAQQNARTLPYAYMERGALYRELGNLDQAESDMRDAMLRISACPDAVLRGQMEGHALLFQGALDLARDPALALPSLDKACAAFDRNSFKFLSMESHFLRASARKALSDVDGAEQDLAVAIELVEERLRQSETTNSGMYFAKPQDVYEAMIDLQLRERQKPDRAFDVAEVSRSRNLLGEIGRRRKEVWAPLTSERVMRGLQPGTVLVEYAVLEDRLVIWALAENSFNVSVVPVERSALQELVSAFRYRIEEGCLPSNVPDESVKLYDLLIRPIEGALSGTSTLVVVPSGPLHALPFSALYDAARDRFLVEAYGICVAPSASVYIECARRARAIGAGAPASVLAVGNPSFDVATFPHLGRLDGAEQEAINIASLYPNAHLLLRDEATSRRFLQLARESEVVHFAGHALIRDDVPEYSTLVLAPQPGSTLDLDTGRLSARDISTDRFTRTRLVVLAACRSGAVPASSGEGVSGLAKPFLAAGIPAVVTGLWDIEDVPAAQFGTVFHRRLRQGETAVGALRNAQLDMLRNLDSRLRSLRTWAAFEVVGGETE